MRIIKVSCSRKKQTTAEEIQTFALTRHPWVTSLMRYPFRYPIPIQLPDILGRYCIENIQ